MATASALTGSPFPIPGNVWTNSGVAAAQADSTVIRRSCTSLRTIMSSPNIEQAISRAHQSDKRRSTKIRSRIFSTLSTRAVGKTMCPSEALAAAERQNKSKMDEVRRVVSLMAKARQIEVLQRGKVAGSGPWKGPIRLRLPQSAVPFAYQGIDFRKHPHRYRVARGEQGVLSVEPYKSELLPLWRFSTPTAADKSSRALLARFREYRKRGDFVGMDMARKFLQMGYTRARRYANHRSGRKYLGAVPIAVRGRSGAHGRKIAPLQPDLVKAESAAIFKDAWSKVESAADYRLARALWKKNRG